MRLRCASTGGKASLGGAVRLTPRGHLSRSLGQGSGVRDEAGDLAFTVGDP